MDTLEAIRTVRVIRKFSDVPVTEDEVRTIVDELKARGLEPVSDLTLKYAKFISDDGKTIVGADFTSPPTFWRVILQ